MNNWPTLTEWWRFGGVLALEVGILFVAAKLVTLRLRSAPWRRALWQTAVIAMFIVVVGELNGVRGLMRPRSEPVAIVPPQRTVVVTFKDAEMPAELPLDAAGSSQPMTATQPAVVPRWQQHAAWPALVWLAGALLVASRVLLAQFIALVFRFRCRRIDDAGLNGRTERIRHTLGIRRRVALVVSKRAIAPFTFGTLRPVIVLPQRFTETFTPEQQEAALLHEMAHIAGFDSAWRGMSDLTGALLWWHPLAWLARRELAHASELAADESSLLLHDGPGRLAECLVACANELRRPALTTWLGMDGGGFRSALGQRVTRLLELSPPARLSRPVPWYVRLIAPIICTALLWIGMVMVIKPAAPSSDTWRTSILGNAFAAPPEKPQPAVLSEATKLEIARLVQDGKLHYEAGGYEAARTNLQSALEIDPKNPAALYYLDLVNLQLTAAQTRLRERTNSLERRAIYDKLRQIRLPEWGPIDNLPLSKVIRSLNDEIIRRDTTGKGINLFISPNAHSAGGGAGASPALDPAGLPIPAAGGGTPDLNGVNIRLGTKLKNLDIEEVLNTLMIIAETKLKYSVEDFGIMISPKGNEPTPFHTRFFRIDPDTFQKALQSVQPAPWTNRPARAPGGPGEGAQQGGGSTLKSRQQIGGGIEFLTEAGPASSHVIPLAQQFFKSLGVDMTTPGKAIFYNDRLGLLMVRATLGDLGVIENAFRPFGVEPRAWSPARSASELTNRLSGEQTASGGLRDISDRNRAEAARFVQEGKLFYETGQTEAARTKLQAALQINPTHQDALYYLDLVNARDLAVRARLKDLKMEPKGPTTNQVQAASSTNLQTRFFRIDPNTFQKALESLQLGISTSKLRQQNGGGIGFVRDGTSAASNVVLLAQQFFKAAGVDLSAPDKAVFFSDRNGALMVRATLTELDVVDKAMQMLNMNPPQVEIRVKVMEVRRDESNKLGTDLFLGTITNGTAGGRRLAKDLTVEQLRAAPAQTPTISGILTDPQFRLVIKALEQRGGADLLSAPSVTTVSGRQAQIKVVDIKYIVTDLDIKDQKPPKKPDAKPGAAPAKNAGVTAESQASDDGPIIQPIAEPFELGPVVDIVPFVQADGWTIQMTVIPSLQEFIGYDDPGAFVASVPDGKTNRVTSPTPLPKFRLRKVATSATVWDGQTLVIGAGSARHLEQKHNPDGTTTNTFVEKELFFFITPQLIDAAGNPLHSDETLPFGDLHKGVPNQKRAGESNAANPSGVFPGQRP